MRGSFSLWNESAWTRTVSIATAVGALLMSAGCNFEHYPYSPTTTDTNYEDAGLQSNPTSIATGSAASSACDADASAPCEPACTAVTSADAGYPGSLVAHFTFDGEGDHWLDSEVGVLSLALNPGAQVDDARYSKTRINGAGNSLHLDGGNYAVYTGSATDPLFSVTQASASGASNAGFTVSAYVSLELPEFDDAGAPPAHTMPIVSTMTSDSCGYQLELRWNEGDPNFTLVFGYGYRSAGSTNGCTINELKFALPQPQSPLGGWGMGSWHHVAGTYIEDGAIGLATLRLYWDGQRVASEPGQTSEAAPRVVVSDNTLYVGSNADQSAMFRGYIDDIAIFNQPLADGELSSFLTQSTTRPGPSQCRWKSREFWGQFAPAATTATWQMDSTPDSAHVLVNDANFGMGELAAVIVPPKDLRLFGRAYIDATVQSGQAFTFKIFNSDKSCLWMLLGVGARHKYSIDLGVPDACYMSACTFPLDKIDLISIGSEWIAPPIRNPTSDNPVRSPGPVDITVHNVGFELAPNPMTDWSCYGGASGVNGWCWRPFNYDLGGGARWANDPSAASVSAWLSGRPESSTRLAAVFNDHPYQLPKNACVLLDANSNFDYKKSNQTLAFVVNDSVDSWGSWDITLPLLGSRAPCMLQLSEDGKRYYSSTGHQPPYETFPNTLDFDHVVSMAIQKPYEDDTVLFGPVEVSIQGMTVYPDDGKNCTTYSNAPSCRPQ